VRTSILRAVVMASVYGSAAWLSAAPPPEPKYKLVLQAPPATSVDSVAVSRDGSLVATAAGEGGVRLYDAHSGAFLRTLGEVGDRGVVFSPDGRTLTAAGFHMDKLVGIFDVQTGQRVLKLPGHTEWEAYATALSPDGKLLASAGTDKQILVWELPAGKLRLQLKDQPQKVSALAFSPDSQTLASGSGDQLVRLWDATSGELRRSLGGHRDWVAALAFSPDGQTLASASCDWGFHRGHDWPRPAGRGPENSEWKLWEVASGNVRRTVASQGRLLAIAFAPSGRTLACGLDKEVRLFDLTADAAPRVLTTHDATVTSLAFTPDGEALLSSSHDQTVKRTEVATGKTEWRAPGHFEQVNSVALSADASLLVTGSSDIRFARTRVPAGAAHIGPGAVRLWDLRTGRLLRRLGDPAEQVLAAAISADGRLVAAGGGVASGAGVVHLWDAATGAALWSTSDHAQEVLAIAFAPDSALVATASADGALQLRNAKSGAALRTLSGHAGGATSLAFSQDGQLLACGEGYGGTRIWNPQTGQLLQACPAASSQAETFAGDRLLNSIGISRDGTLATCTSSVNNEFVDAVRLWDARAGKLKRSFAAEQIHGRPMALSPDGSLVATGGKSVKLWDVRTGKMLRELYGHLKRTQSITFSADGRLLVAGGSYGTTNAWEVASGRHLATLLAFDRNDDWLAWTHDGIYDGSPAVERYLAWRVGDELQSGAALGPQLRRAELLRAALQLKMPQESAP